MEAEPLFRGQVGSSVGRLSWRLVSNLGKRGWGWSSGPEEVGGQSCSGGRAANLAVCHPTLCTAACSPMHWVQDKPGTELQPSEDVLNDADVSGDTGRSVCCRSWGRVCAMRGSVHTRGTCTHVCAHMYAVCEHPDSGTTAHGRPAARWGDAG